MAAVVRAFQEREMGLAVLVTESDLNRARLLTDRIFTIECGETRGSPGRRSCRRPAGRPPTRPWISGP
jgi:ABC-type uncharacterized transport system ATPase subunit